MTIKKRRISISVNHQTFDLLSRISQNSGIPVSELVSSFVEGINPFLFTFDRSFSDIVSLRRDLASRLDTIDKLNSTK